ncbi:MAG: DUF4923 family protein [Bacteroidales bacterium]|nr:DUF4923 family protein [Bacteroidales bacterium]
MKKIITICMIAAACVFGQQVKAQSFLESILSGIAQGGSGGDILGSVLNGAVTSANSTSKGGNLGSVLGNVISSVTGSATTTQANLVGSWTYNEPAVQFESKNLLTKAGGAAAATKVENKLATFYNMMGIRTGRVNFIFDNNGGVTYTLGSRSYKGTYTFDKQSKTVTMTTPSGQNLKAYVTISGNNMSLCFDSTKVLNLFTTISKSYNSTISALAGNYDGMKTGFKFTRK